MENIKYGNNISDKDVITYLKTWINACDVANPADNAKVNSFKDLVYPINGIDNQWITEVDKASA
jgi:hypothetical protein